MFLMFGSFKCDRHSDRWVLNKKYGIHFCGELVIIRIDKIKEINITLNNCIYFYLFTSFKDKNRFNKHPLDSRLETGHIKNIIPTCSYIKIRLAADRTAGMHDSSLPKCIILLLLHFTIAII